MLCFFFAISSPLSFAAGSFSTFAGYSQAIQTGGYASMADAAIGSCKITNMLSPPAGFKCEFTFSLHPNWANNHFPDNIGPKAVITGYYTDATYWTNTSSYATYPYYPITYDPNIKPKIKDLGPRGGGGCVANPISPGSGNKHQVEIDLVSGGFGRYYQASVYVRNANFGSNWRHVYDRNIASFDRFAYVYRDHGQGYSYERSGTAYLPDPDIPDRLVELKDPSGTRTGWKYTTAEDEVELYDPSGKLLSITNRVGLTQTLTYSDGTSGPNGGVVLDANGNPTSAVLPAGLLIRVSDASARSLNFGYDASSRIVKMTDPAGGVFHYRYDTANNLSSVSYPDATPSDPTDNPNKTYLYNEPALTSGANLPHALTGILDENGDRYASYSYDAQGRAIASEHAGGAERVSLNYSVDPNTNNGNGTTIVTDARNTSRTYSFQTILGVVKNTGVSQPGGSGCGPAASNLTYDGNGNVATRTDFNGNQTRYTYDLTRNLETSRTEALTASGANTAYTRTTQTDWHPTFRLPIKITEALGKPEQRITTYSYDPASGNILNKTITETATGKTRSWTYTYTTASDGTLPNLLKTENGPRTDVADLTTYTYYPNGDLKTVTNALGHLTQFTLYDAHGRPLTVIDPNGVETQLTYTARGWLASRSIAGRNTLYSYDKVGQLKRITLADGSYIDYTYDAAHRLTDIADRALNRIHYTLDAMGNRIQEDIYDANNTLNLSKRRSFDALNRLWQDIARINSSSEATTTYGYDANGNLKTLTDPLTRSTTLTYDALNRLSQSTDALNLNQRYDYDALDQLSGVTDPRALITRYQTTAFGNINQETSPDRGLSLRVFDEAGNLKSATDARGIRANYSYDALNRLSSVSYPALGENLNYTWDSYPGCNYGRGRLCRIVDSEGATTFAYDPHGNLSQTTRVRNSVSYLTQYGYDAANRLISQTTPSGETVSLLRNPVGRIERVTASHASGSQILAQQLRYTGAGQLAAQTLGNGVKQSADFDLSGRLANQSANRIQGDGDLNGDGLVNVADVALAERIALNLVSASAEQLARGDVAPATPNGVIDAADVARIRRKALGLEGF